MREIEPGLYEYVSGDCDEVVRRVPEPQVVREPCNSECFEKIAKAEAERDVLQAKLPGYEAEADRLTCENVALQARVRELEAQLAIATCTEERPAILRAQRAEARVRELEAVGRDEAADRARLARELADAKADLLAEKDDRLSAEARERALREAGRGMVLAADCSWEQGGGHDWHEACEQMRAALRTGQAGEGGEG